MGALARTLWQTKIPPGRFYLNHPGAQGLLSGTKYWGTQRGGANNHQTLMLSNRQERSYTSCLTTEGWLHFARPLRASSASPDVWGQTPSRPTPEGWTPPRPTSRSRLRLARRLVAGLRLARCLGADSTSPDVRGQTLPRSMSGDGLRLARCLGADSALPND